VHSLGIGIGIGIGQFGVDVVGEFGIKDFHLDPISDPTHEQMQQIGCRGGAAQADCMTWFRDIELAQREPGPAGIGKNPFQAAKDIGAIKAEGKLDGW
jgi:hypothetical protein